VRVECRVKPEGGEGQRHNARQRHRTVRHDMRCTKVGDRVGDDVRSTVLGLSPGLGGRQLVLLRVGTLATASCLLGGLGRARRQQFGPVDGLRRVVADARVLARRRWGPCEGLLGRVVGAIAVEVWELVLR
jgi:hypothetical protein